MAILSRSFCNTDLVTDLNDVKNVFNNGLNEIRNFENELTTKSDKYFQLNHKLVCERVKQIVNTIK
jgi:hypothetical protein